MPDLFQGTFQIQNLLSQSNIPTAVIGGLAVAIWGEPRLTRDADLKVLLNRDQAERLVDLLRGGYRFLTAQKLKDPVLILKKMGFLFVQDVLGSRIDLLLAETPFDEKVIQRARRIEPRPRLPLVICTAEDLIIYKMISTRPRDREDVKGIVYRQEGRLDDRYILNWLGQFEKALDDSTLIKEYRNIRPA